MRTRHVRAVVLMVVALVATLPAAPSTGQAGPDLAEVLEVVKTDQVPAPSDLSVLVSQATPFVAPDRVVIARDDAFADALASGVLLDGAPLLLVPGQSPLPESVVAEIARLGSSRALVLGGPAAVSDAVLDELRGLGLAVERRQGPDRVATAVSIAATDAPTATTAILARAFPTEGGEATQAFADSLAAGALAARNGWPVLLTETDRLSPATRAHLEASTIDRVLVVGGTAAIGGAVEAEVAGLVAEVTRIAGPSRGATAVEVAKVDGTQDAGDLDRVVLVDGAGPMAWAAGFPAAAHAAVVDAPILLVDGTRLFDETRDFLEAADEGAVGVTCVVHPLACSEGRALLGLGRSPLLEYDPPTFSQVVPGQVLTGTLTPVEQGAGLVVEASGSCVGAPQEATADGTGRFEVTLADPLPEDCQLVSLYSDGVGGQRTTQTTYTTGVGRPADSRLIAGSLTVYSPRTPFPTVPLYAATTTTCADDPADPAQQTLIWAAFLEPGTAALRQFTGTDGVTAADQATTCTASLNAPPAVGRVLWGVYALADGTFRFPYALGVGTQVTLDLADLPLPPRDLRILWVLEDPGETPALGTPPADAEPGTINRDDAIGVRCDGQDLTDRITVVEVGTLCTASTGGGQSVLVLQAGQSPQTGQEVTFTVTASPFQTRVTRAVAASQELGGSCAVPIPLTLGEAVQVSQLGERIFHVIEVEAGEELRIRHDLRSPDANGDPRLVVRDAAGAEIASNDDAEQSTNALIEFTAPADGRYCIEADATDGTFEFVGRTLLAVDPAPLSDTQVVLDAGNPEHVVPIDVPVGTRIVVEARALPGDPLDPQALLAEFGGTEEDFAVVAADADGGGGRSARIEYVTVRDVQHRLLVERQGEAFGDVRVAVSLLAPAE